MFEVHDLDVQGPSCCIPRSLAHFEHSSQSEDLSWSWQPEHSSVFTRILFASVRSLPCRGRQPIRMVTAFRGPTDFPTETFSETTLVGRFATARNAGNWTFSLAQFFQQPSRPGTLLTIHVPTSQSILCRWIWNAPFACCNIQEQD